MFFLMMLISCGTPLVDRLRKRKITSLPVTDVKENRKPDKANSSGGRGSSITSKKCRRQWLNRLHHIRVYT
jgi:hypothetical protein